MRYWSLSVPNRYVIDVHRVEERCASFTVIADNEHSGIEMAREDASDTDYTDKKVVNVDYQHVVQSCAMIEKTEYEYTRSIACACGQWECFDGDEQRLHSQSFTFVDIIDDNDELGVNNEAVYKCPDCGALVVSKTENIPKEEEE